MKFRIITLVLLFTTLFSNNLISQVITADPSFPTDADMVTITFDASQGSMGLIGHTGDVYTHTGVITDLSTSNSDWKYVKTNWGQNTADTKLTRTGTNTYTLTISPDIRTYYGVPNGEEIQKLSFVFRNEDGSVTGKDVGETDIFYDINNSGLATSITSPDGDFLLVDNVGDMINVVANASETADLALYDNNTLIASQASATTLSHTITVSTGGNHEVLFVADNGTQKDTSSFTYIVLSTGTPADPPAGTEYGITYLSDTSVRLYFQAPNKQNVFVLGDFNNWNLNASYQMTQTTDGESYWIDITGLTPGEEYGFQYLVDGSIRIGDPFSELVLDPWNDQYIPASTFPNLKPYPLPTNEGIISVLQTAQTDYVWQVTDFQRPAKTDLVIYELLVRDFVANHDYNTLIDTLDYLENLGINAIELLPVSEFSGNSSWGYNPSYHTALDKYYGTKNDFKRFVDECHKRGIAVFLDVVYNHVDGYLSPIGRLYWNDATNKPSPDNIWLNVDAPHDFSVFNDFNHESQYTKDYLDKCNRYWMEEYNIDGYRFDLTKGFTQNEGKPFHAGDYDATRIAILKRMADVIWDLDSEFFVILEHFGNNQEEKELSDYGFMLWGNSNHDYSDCSTGNVASSDISWSSYLQRGWSEPNVVAYMESHDEERLMYRNLNEGKNNGGYNIKDLATALERQALVTAFFYTIPGPKMLWQFGEVGYDVSIDFNGRTGEKPIRWNYFEEANRKLLYDITRDLIHLKSDLAFTGNNIQMNVGNNVPVKNIKINHSSMDVAIIGNFDLTSKTVNFTFQEVGTWYNYMSGTSFELTDLTQSITLEPGEFRIYTTKQIARPSGVYTQATSIFRPNLQSYDLSITPNPNFGALNIAYTLKENAKAVSIEIIDLVGKVIAQPMTNTRKTIGKHRFEYQHQLPSGTYFIRLTVDGKIDVQKLIVTP